MGIISYAQNFEDVLLWRALGHIESGCYIDIGAHDPIVDSVSKAFYEHGWRGIHVEPLPVYCDALRRDRPDETVLQAAVAAETGILRFFEIPDTGISTGNEAIALSHRDRGFQINEITVPCVTLAQVFQLVKGDVVHWLKIDVEGLEAQVLQGWGETKLRPWIVVVESTLPLTQDEVYGSWEGLLLEKGYRYIHFDGLNRYYLAEAQVALKAAFRSGPNVFDGFQFNGTANNPFCNHVAQRLRSDLDGQIESLKQQALQHQSDQLRLGELVQSLEKLKQAFQAEQTANLQNQNAAKALALQAEQHARQRSEIQLCTAVQREQDFTAQLLAGKDQLQQSEQAHRARERQLQEQLTQAEQQSRQEIEALLRTAVQREQDFMAQLLAGKDQLQQSEQAHRVRERQLQEQLTQAEQQSRQEIEALLRTAVQREQDFMAQLLAGKDQLQQSEQAHRVRERQLQEQLTQAEQQSRQEIEALLRTAMQREQEFTVQLLAAKDQLQQLHAVEELGFQHELADKNAEIRKISIEIELIRNSLSWRLTKPFRYFCDENRNRIESVKNIQLIALEGGMHSLEKKKELVANNLIEVVRIEDRKNYQLNDFLCYHDQDFIEKLYRCLLKRDPDGEGLAYYLERIRKGISREAIIAQLLKSEEAQLAGVSVDGLSTYILLAKIFSFPIIGAGISGLYFLLNVNNHLRDLRALENHVYRISADVKRICK